MNGIGNAHADVAVIPGFVSAFVNVSFNTSLSPAMFAGSFE